MLPFSTMIKCSYCGKEIDRNVFCKPSCKTMFHRKKKDSAIRDTIIKKKKKKPKAWHDKLPDTMEDIETGDRIPIRQEPEEIKLCEHGAKIGLCKHGCKK